MKPISYIVRGILIIIPALLPFNGLSQSGTPGSTSEPEGEDVNLQLWLDYNPRYIINTKSSLYANTGFRTNFTDKLYRIYTKPSFRYDITRYNEKRDRYRTWQLIGGLAFYYNINPEVTDVLEIRPFQGLKFRFPNFDRINLSHYFRLEERLEIGMRPTATNFSIRGRYKVGTEIYLPGKLLTQGLYLPLSIELFFNLSRGAQFNDLMRLTPGLGYQPNTKWKFQFELSYHRSRLTSEDRFKTNDIVIRFRVYQVL